MIQREDLVSAGRRKGLARPSGENLSGRLDHHAAITQPGEIPVRSPITNGSRKIAGCGFQRVGKMKPLSLEIMKGSQRESGDHIRPPRGPPGQWG